jgi:hypothetical protein
MKGCLGKLMVLFIALITCSIFLLGGVYSGYLMLKDSINTQLSPTPQELKARSQQFADFSKLPPGYIVTQAVDLLGFKMVVAENRVTNQVMAFIDPGILISVSQEDVVTGELVKKIEDLKSKINQINSVNQGKFFQGKFQIDSFNVERKDSFKALSQSIPYLKANLAISGDNSMHLKGIIGVVKDLTTGKSMFIISYNEPKKYKQIICDRFFQSVQFYKEYENY